MSILYSNKIILNKLFEGFGCPLSDLSLLSPSHAPSLSKGGTKKLNKVILLYLVILTFSLASWILYFMQTCPEFIYGASVYPGCWDNPDIFI